MARIILGLDVGGANLKAATTARECASVPFPLWQEPHNLPRALGELAAKFPDAEELAVTMTGELCDCFATKRDGVNAILNAVLNVSRSRPIRVWGTDGIFRNSEEARREHRVVAAANWHALATWCGDFIPEGPGLLVDVGSTTTDIIPICNGLPVSRGKTDTERMAHGELLYTGVRRTPVCAILGTMVAAELFATTADGYLLLDALPEDASRTDTADGRPFTRDYAHARMARMLCADADDVSHAATLDMATLMESRQLVVLIDGIKRAEQHAWKFKSEKPGQRTYAVVAGSGEFLARKAVAQARIHSDDVRLLSEELGPALSACAPAYAVAVLAKERPA